MTITAWEHYANQFTSEPTHLFFHFRKAAADVYGQNFLSLVERENIAQRNGHTVYPNNGLVEIPFNKETARWFKNEYEKKLRRWLGRQNDQIKIPDVEAFVRETITPIYPHIALSDELENVQHVNKNSAANIISSELLNHVCLYDGFYPSVRLDRLGSAIRAQWVGTRQSDGGNIATIAIGNNQSLELRNAGFKTLDDEHLVGSETVFISSDFIQEHDRTIDVIHNEPSYTQLSAPFQDTWANPDLGKKGYDLANIKITLEMQNSDTMRFIIKSNIFEGRREDSRDPIFKEGSQIFENLRAATFSLRDGNIISQNEGRMIYGFLSALHAGELNFLYVIDYLSIQSSSPARVFSSAVGDLFMERLNQKAAAPEGPAQVFAEFLTLEKYRSTPQLLMDDLVAVAGELLDENYLSLAEREAFTRQHDVRTYPIFDGVRDEELVPADSDGGAGGGGDSTSSGGGRRDGGNSATGPPSGSDPPANGGGASSSGDRPRRRAIERERQALTGFLKHFRVWALNPGDIESVPLAGNNLFLNTPERRKRYGSFRDQISNPETIKLLVGMATDEDRFQHIVGLFHQLWFVPQNMLLVTNSGTLSLDQETFEKDYTVADIRQTRPAVSINSVDVPIYEVGLPDDFDTPLYTPLIGQFMPEGQSFFYFNPERTRERMNQLFQGPNAENAEAGVDFLVTVAFLDMYRRMTASPDQQIPAHVIYWLAAQRTDPLQLVSTSGSGQDYHMAIRAFYSSLPGQGPNTPIVTLPNLLKDLTQRDPTWLRNTISSFLDEQLQQVAVPLIDYPDKLGLIDRLVEISIKVDPTDHLSLDPVYSIHQVDSNPPAVPPYANEAIEFNDGNQLQDDVKNYLRSITRGLLLGNKIIFEISSDESETLRIDKGENQTTIIRLGSNTTAMTKEQIAATGIGKEIAHFSRMGYVLTKDQGTRLFDLLDHTKSEATLVQSVSFDSLVDAAPDNLKPTWRWLGREINKAIPKWTKLGLNNEGLSVFILRFINTNWAVPHRVYVGRFYNPNTEEDVAGLADIIMNAGEMTAGASRVRILHVAPQGINGVHHAKAEHGTGYLAIPASSLEDAHSKWNKKKQEFPHAQNSAYAEMYRIGAAIIDETNAPDGMAETSVFITSLAELIIKECTAPLHLIDQTGELARQMKEEGIAEDLNAIFNGNQYDIWQLIYNFVSVVHPSSQYDYVHDMILSAIPVQPDGSPHFSDDAFKDDTHSIHALTLLLQIRGDFGIPIVPVRNYRGFLDVVKAHLAIRADHGERITTFREALLQQFRGMTKGQIDQNKRFLRGVTTRTLDNGNGDYAGIHFPLLPNAPSEDEVAATDAPASADAAEHQGTYFDFLGVYGETTQNLTARPAVQPIDPDNDVDFESGISRVIQTKLRAALAARGITGTVEVEKGNDYKANINGASAAPAKAQVITLPKNVISETHSDEVDTIVETAMNKLVRARHKFEHEKTEIIKDFLKALIGGENALQDIEIRDLLTDHFSNDEKIVWEWILNNLVELVPVWKDRAPSEMIVWDFVAHFLNLNWYYGYDLSMHTYHQILIGKNFVVGRIMVRAGHIPINEEGGSQIPVLYVSDVGTNKSALARPGSLIINYDFFTAYLSHLDDVKTRSYTVRGEDFSFKWYNHLCTILADTSPVTLGTYMFLRYLGYVLADLWASRWDPSSADRFLNNLRFPYRQEEDTPVNSFFASSLLFPDIDGPISTFIHGILFPTDDKARPAHPKNLSNQKPVFPEESGAFVIAAMRLGNLTPPGLTLNDEHEKIWERLSLVGWDFDDSRIDAHLKPYDADLRRISRDTSPQIRALAATPEGKTPTVTVVEGGKQIELPVLTNAPGLPGTYFDFHGVYAETTASLPEKPKVTPLDLKDDVTFEMSVSRPIRTELGKALRDRGVTGKINVRGGIEFFAAFSNPSPETHTTQKINLKPGVANQTGSEQVRDVVKKTMHQVNLARRRYEERKLDALKNYIRNLVRGWAPHKDLPILINRPSSGEPRQWRWITQTLSTLVPVWKQRARNDADVVELIVHFLNQHWYDQWDQSLRTGSEGTLESGLAVGRIVVRAGHMNEGASQIPIFYTTELDGTRESWLKPIGIASLVRPGAITLNYNFFLLYLHRLHELKNETHTVKGDFAIGWYDAHVALSRQYDPVQIVGCKLLHAIGSFVASLWAERWDERTRERFLTLPRFLGAPEQKDDVIFDFAAFLLFPQVLRSMGLFVHQTLFLTDNNGRPLYPGNLSNNEPDAFAPHLKTFINVALRISRLVPADGPFIEDQDALIRKLLEIEFRFDDSQIASLVEPYRDAFERISHGASRTIGDQLVPPNGEILSVEAPEGTDSDIRFPVFRNAPSLAAQGSDGEETGSRDQHGPGHPPTGPPGRGGPPSGGPSSPGDPNGPAGGRNVHMERGPHLEFILGLLWNWAQNPNDIPLTPVTLPQTMAQLHSEDPELFRRFADTVKQQETIDRLIPLETTEERMGVLLEIAQNEWYLKRGFLLISTGVEYPAGPVDSIFDQYTVAEILDNSLQPIVHDDQTYPVYIVGPYSLPSPPNITGFEGQAVSSVNKFFYMDKKNFQERLARNVEQTTESIEGNASLEQYLTSSLIESGMRTQVGVLESMQLIILSQIIPISNVGNDVPAGLSAITFLSAALSRNPLSVISIWLRAAHQPHTRDEWERMARILGIDTEQDMMQIFRAFHELGVERFQRGLRRLLVEQFADSLRASSILFDWMGLFERILPDDLLPSAWSVFAAPDIPVVQPTDHDSFDAVYHTYEITLDPPEIAPYRDDDIEFRGFDPDPESEAYLRSIVRSTPLSTKVVFQLSSTPNSRINIKTEFNETTAQNETIIQMDTEFVSGMTPQTLRELNLEESLNRLSRISYLLTSQQLNLLLNQLNQADITHIDFNGIITLGTDNLKPILGWLNQEINNAISVWRRSDTIDNQMIPVFIIRFINDHFLVPHGAYFGNFKDAASNQTSYRMSVVLLDAGRMTAGVTQTPILYVQSYEAQTVLYPIRVEGNGYQVIPYSLLQAEKIRDAGRQTFNDATKSPYPNFYQFGAELLRDLPSSEGYTEKAVLAKNLATLFVKGCLTTVHPRQPAVIVQGLQNAGFNQKFIDLFNEPSGASQLPLLLSWLFHPDSHYDFILHSLLLSIPTQANGKLLVSKVNLGDHIQGNHHFRVLLAIGAVLGEPVDQVQDYETLYAFLKRMDTIRRDEPDRIRAVKDELLQNLRVATRLQINQTIPFIRRSTNRTLEASRGVYDNAIFPVLPNAPSQEPAEISPGETESSDQQGPADGRDVEVERRYLPLILKQLWIWAQDPQQISSTPFNVPDDMIQKPEDRALLAAFTRLVSSQEITSLLRELSGPEDRMELLAVTTHGMWYLPRGFLLISTGSNYPLGPPESIRDQYTVAEILDNTLPPITLGEKPQPVYIVGPYTLPNDPGTLAIETQFDNNDSAFHYVSSEIFRQEIETDAQYMKTSVEQDQRLEPFLSSHFIEGEWRYHLSVLEVVQMLLLNKIMDVLGQEREAQQDFYKAITFLMAALSTNPFSLLAMWILDDDPATVEDQWRMLAEVLGIDSNRDRVDVFNDFRNLGIEAFRRGLIRLVAERFPGSLWVLPIQFDWMGLLERLLPADLLALAQRVFQPRLVMPILTPTTHASLDDHYHKAPAPAEQPRDAEPDESETAEQDVYTSETFSQTLFNAIVTGTHSHPHSVLFGAVQDLAPERDHAAWAELENNLNAALLAWMPVANPNETVHIEFILRFLNQHFFKPRGLLVYLTIHAATQQQGFAIGKIDAQTGAWHSGAGVTEGFYLAPPDASFHLQAAGARGESDQTFLLSLFEHRDRIYERVRMGFDDMSGPYKEFYLTIQRYAADDGVTADDGKKDLFLDLLTKTLMEGWVDPLNRYLLGTDQEIGVMRDEGRIPSDLMPLFQDDPFLNYASSMILAWAVRGNPKEPFLTKLLVNSLPLDQTYSPIPETIDFSDPAIQNEASLRTLVILGRFFRQAYPEQFPFDVGDVSNYEHRLAFTKALHQFQTEHPDKLAEVQEKLRDMLRDVSQGQSDEVKAEFEKIEMIPVRNERYPDLRVPVFAHSASLPQSTVLTNATDARPGSDSPDGDEPTLPGDGTPNPVPDYVLDLYKDNNGERVRIQGLDDFYAPLPPPERPRPQINQADNDNIQFYIHRNDGGNMGDEDGNFPPPGLFSNRMMSVIRNNLKRCLIADTYSVVARKNISNTRARYVHKNGQFRVVFEIPAANLNRTDNNTIRRVLRGIHARYPDPQSQKQALLGNNLNNYLVMRVFEPAATSSLDDVLSQLPEQDRPYWEWMARELERLIQHWRANGNNSAEDIMTRVTQWLNHHWFLERDHILLNPNKGGEPNRYPLQILRVVGTVGYTPLENDTFSPIYYSANTDTTPPEITFTDWYDGFNQHISVTFIESAIQFTHALRENEWRPTQANLNWEQSIRPFIPQKNTAQLFEAYAIESIARLLFAVWQFGTPDQGTLDLLSFATSRFEEPRHGLSALEPLMPKLIFADRINNFLFSLAMAMGPRNPTTRYYPTREGPTANPGNLPVSMINLMNLWLRPADVMITNEMGTHDEIVGLLPQLADEQFSIQSNAQLVQLARQTHDALTTHLSERYERTRSFVNDTYPIDVRIGNQTLAVPFLANSPHRQPVNEDELFGLTDPSPPGGGRSPTQPPARGTNPAPDYVRDLYLDQNGDRVSIHGIDQIYRDLAPEANRPAIETIRDQDITFESDIAPDHQIPLRHYFENLTISDTVLVRTAAQETVMVQYALTSEGAQLTVTIPADWALDDQTSTSLRILRGIHDQIPRIQGEKHAGLIQGLRDVLKNRIIDRDTSATLDALLPLLPLRDRPYWSWMSKTFEPAVQVWLETFADPNVATVAAIRWLNEHWFLIRDLKIEHVESDRGPWALHLFQIVSRTGYVPRHDESFSPFYALSRIAREAGDVIFTTKTDGFSAVIDYDHIQRAMNFIRALRNGEWDPPSEMELWRVLVEEVMPADLTDEAVFEKYLLDMVAATMTGFWGFDLTESRINEILSFFTTRFEKGIRGAAAFNHLVPIGIFGERAHNLLFALAMILGPRSDRDDYFPHTTESAVHPHLLMPATQALLSWWRRGTGETVAESDLLLDGDRETMLDLISEAGPSGRLTSAEHQETIQQTETALDAFSGGRLEGAQAFFSDMPTIQIAHNGQTDTVQVFRNSPDLRVPTDQELFGFTDPSPPPTEPDTETSSSTEETDDSSTQRTDDSTDQTADHVDGEESDADAEEGARRQRRRDLLDGLELIHIETHGETELWDPYLRNPDYMSTAVVAEDGDTQLIIDQFYTEPTDEMAELRALPLSDEFLVRLLDDTDFNLEALAQRRNVPIDVVNEWVHAFFFRLIRDSHNNTIRWAHIFEERGWRRIADRAITFYFTSNLFRDERLNQPGDNDMLDLVHTHGLDEPGIATARNTAPEVVHRWLVSFVIHHPQRQGRTGFIVRTLGITSEELDRWYRAYPTLPEIAEFARSGTPDFGVLLESVRRHRGVLQHVAEEFEVDIYVVYRWIYQEATDEFRAALLAIRPDQNTIRNWLLIFRGNTDAISSVYDIPADTLSGWMDETDRALARALQQINQTGWDLLALIQFLEAVDEGGTPILTRQQAQDLLIWLNERFRDLFLPLAARPTLHPQVYGLSQAEPTFETVVIENAYDFVHQDIHVHRVIGNPDFGDHHPSVTSKQEIISFHIRIRVRPQYQHLHFTHIAVRGAFHSPQRLRYDQETGTYWAEGTLRLKRRYRDANNRVRFFALDARADLGTVIQGPEYEANILYEGVGRLTREQVQVQMRILLERYSSLHKSRLVRLNRQRQTIEHALLGGFTQDREAGFAQLNEMIAMQRGTVQNHLDDIGDGADDLTSHVTESYLTDPSTEAPIRVIPWMNQDPQLEGHPALAEHVDVLRILLDIRRTFNDVKVFPFPVLTVPPEEKRSFPEEVAIYELYRRYQAKIGTIFHSPWNERVLQSLGALVVHGDEKQNVLCVVDKNTVKDSIHLLSQFNQEIPYLDLASGEVSERDAAFKQVLDEDPNTARVIFISAEYLMGVHPTKGWDDDRPIPVEPLALSKLHTRMWDHLQRNLGVIAVTGGHQLGSENNRLAGMLRDLAPPASRVMRVAFTTVPSLHPSTKGPDSLWRLLHFIDSGLVPTDNKKLVFRSNSDKDRLALYNLVREKVLFLDPELIYGSALDQRLPAEQRLRHVNRQRIGTRLTADQMIHYYSRMVRYYLQRIVSAQGLLRLLYGPEKLETLRRFLTGQIDKKKDKFKAVIQLYFREDYRHDVVAMLEGRWPGSVIVYDGYDEKKTYTEGTGRSKVAIRFQVDPQTGKVMIDEASGEPVRTHRLENSRTMSVLEYNELRFRFSKNVKFLVTTHSLWSDRAERDFPEITDVVLFDPEGSTHRHEEPVFHLRPRADGEELTITHITGEYPKEWFSSDNFHLTPLFIETFFGDWPVDQQEVERIGAMVQAMRQVLEVYGHAHVQMLEAQQQVRVQDTDPDAPRIAGALQMMLDWIRRLFRSNTMISLTQADVAPQQRQRDPNEERDLDEEEQWIRDSIAGALRTDQTLFSGSHPWNDLAREDAFSELVGVYLYRFLGPNERMLPVDAQQIQDPQAQETSHYATFSYELAQSQTQSQADTQTNGRPQSFRLERAQTRAEAQAADTPVALGIRPVFPNQADRPLQSLQKLMETSYNQEETLDREGRNVFRNIESQIIEAMRRPDGATLIRNWASFFHQLRVWSEATSVLDIKVSFLEIAYERFISKFEIIPHGQSPLEAPGGEIVVTFNFFHSLEEQEREAWFKRLLVDLYNLHHPDNHVERWSGDVSDWIIGNVHLFWARGDLAGFVKHVTYLKKRLQDRLNRGPFTPNVPPPPAADQPNPAQGGTTTLMSVSGTLLFITVGLMTMTTYVGVILMAALTLGIFVSLGWIPNRITPLQSMFWQKMLAGRSADLQVRHIGVNLRTMSDEEWNRFVGGLSEKPALLERLQKSKGWLSKLISHFTTGRAAQKEWLLPVTRDDWTHVVSLVEKGPRERQYHLMVDSADVSAFEEKLARNPSMKNRIFLLAGDNAFEAEGDLHLVDPADLEGAVGTLLSKGVSRDQLAIGFFHHVRIKDDAANVHPTSILHGITILSLLNNLLPRPMTLRDWKRLRQLTNLIHSQA